MFAPLVPAYNACTSANRAHAAPLGMASCNPPAQSSGQLTTGTPDANMNGANFTGSVKLRVINGTRQRRRRSRRRRHREPRGRPQALRPERLHRTSSRSTPTLRITDRLNGPGETGTGSGLRLPAHGAVHRDRGHERRLDLLAHDDGRQHQRRERCARTAARTGSWASVPGLRRRPDGLAATPGNSALSRSRAYLFRSSGR